MNAEIKKAAISKEQLLADGWVETTENPLVIFEKTIENRNPINATPEDTDIKLIVHSYTNVWRFGIQFPDGGILNFVANSMRELKDFESRLDFYDCPY